MDEPSSDLELVERWRDGDDGAVNELFERYFQRLMRVVGRHLAAKFNARLDPDDVVQSIWKSMHRMAHEGKLEFQDDGEFWRLLVTVALNKVRNKVRYHGAIRRSPTREVSSSDSAQPMDDYLAERLCRQPSAAEMVEFADLLENILQHLNERERQLVLLRIEGRNQKEIAGQLGVDERTVRRMSQRIRDRSAALVGELDAGGSL